MLELEQRKRAGTSCDLQSKDININSMSKDNSNEVSNDNSIFLTDNKDSPKQPLNTAFKTFWGKSTNIKLSK